MELWNFTGNSVLVFDAFNKTILESKEVQLFNINNEPFLVYTESIIQTSHSKRKKEITSYRPLKTCPVMFTGTRAINWYANTATNLCKLGTARGQSSATSKYLLRQIHRPSETETKPTVGQRFQKENMTIRNHKRLQKFWYFFMAYEVSGHPMCNVSI